MGAGKNLQSVLRNRNVSIAQLSRETGISSNTLYAMIKRDSDINTTTMSKLSQYLGITVDELSTLLTNGAQETKETFPDSHILDCEMDTTSTDTKELITKLNSLTQDYEEKLIRSVQLRKELEVKQKLRVEIEHEIQELRVRLEVLENDLKNRRLELCMIREKF